MSERGPRRLAKMATRLEGKKAGVIIAPAKVSLYTGECHTQKAADRHAASGARHKRRKLRTHENQ